MQVIAKQEIATRLSVEFPIDIQGGIHKLQGNEMMFYSMLEWFEAGTLNKNMMSLSKNIQLKQWEAARKIVSL